MRPPRRPRLAAFAASALALGAAPALAHAGAACAVPAELERQLRPGGLVLMGEVHGTAEAPAAFGAAVCDALAQGRMVSAGLEFSREQAGPLGAFLASDGGKAAVADLLRSAFWTRSSQDGRSSTAMLALVQRLRQLKQGYPALAVFSLEDDSGVPAAGAGTTRDQRMAARVRAEHARRPQALILTLSGNLHNRLKPGDQSSALPAPMGSFLADLAPVSVLLATTGGTAWVCMPECGAQAWPASGTQPAGPLPAFRALAGASPYTGQWSLGPSTAAPPAVSAAN